MPTPEIPPAPQDLSPERAELWRVTLEEFDPSPSELALLAEALRALDRAAEARAVIEADGVVTVDRYGSPKANPAVDIEHRSRVFFAQAMKQLGLAVPVVDPSRPGPKPTPARSR